MTLSTELALPEASRAPRPSPRVAVDAVTVLSLFLLTLVRIVNPAFLVRHSRYAILAIVVLAAIITPTGDIFNLALFATPMIVLFYIGIFASYLLVLRREKRRFPWWPVLRWVLLIVLVLALLAIVTGKYYGYKLVAHWPYFVR